MKKCYLIICLTLLLNACTFVSTTKNVKVFNKDDSIGFENTFFLNYPKNGFEESYFTKKLKENKNSAKNVVDIFKQKMNDSFGNLYISNKNLSLQDAFEEAKLRGDNYLIDMQIITWKDASYILCRPTQSQGTTEVLTKDSVEIVISIYDVNSKILLNRQKLIENGCPIVFFGFIPVGKNSPHSHFKSLLNEWIKSL